MTTVLTLITLAGACIMPFDLEPICVDLDTQIGGVVEFEALESQTWCDDPETLFGEGGRFESVLAVNREWDLVPLCGTPWLGRVEYRPPEGVDSERVSSWMRAAPGRIIDFSDGGEIIFRLMTPGGLSGDAWVRLWQFTEDWTPHRMVAGVQMIPGTPLLELESADGEFGVVRDDQAQYDPTGAEAWMRLVVEPGDPGTVTLYTSAVCGNWSQALQVALTEEASRLSLDALMNLDPVTEDTAPGWISEIYIEPYPPES
jgi:hypothetical protein